MIKIRSTFQGSQARPIGWIALALAAGVLPACKKATPAGGEEGGAEASASAPVEGGPAAPGLAFNQADIMRYPDEKASADSVLTTEGTAELRTEVGTGGNLVAVLKKGTEVSKIAEHAGHYLVVADDPKDATRKLMGWSTEGAFLGGGGGFHGGPAPAHAGGGGAVAAADGGKPGPAPGPTASSSAAPTVAGFSCVKQEAGKCPAGFKANGAVCRLSCSTPAQCKGPDPKCNGGLCYASNGCQ